MSGGRAARLDNKDKSLRKRVATGGLGRQLADEWRKSDHDESFLLHGARLQQFEKWIEATAFVLTERERAFLTTTFARLEIFGELLAERASKTSASKQTRRTP